MQKDRDPSFDAFRGLAIIAVVSIHAAYLVLADDINRYLVAYFNVLLFAVPAFIFISGYWSGQKPMGSSADYRAFLTKRLSRILIPYLFWSFVWLGYEASRTHDFNGSEIIRKLFLGQACIGYYFIILLAQLYILTPLFKYINRKSFGLELVLLLNIISLSILYLSRLFSIIWPLPASLPFYSWIIFYEIGLLAGDYDNRKTLMPKNMRFLILPAIFISLLISELEAMIILSKADNLNFALSATKFSSVFYSVCVILGFLLVREHIKYWPKSLVILGNFSFGIYLIHGPILNQAARLVQKSSIIYSFQSLYQFTVVLITILVCFALIYIIRKLLPESFCSKILGF
jgi:fucose 4-O-acetylase-like acetyltransferase